MTSSKPKLATDISGVEYDWLACDAVGFVALFSTAGAGFAPDEFLQNTDAHDLALEAILKLSPTTQTVFAPALAPELINTWQLVAERGFFAYDCLPTGGPYRLVAVPKIPLNVKALPAHIASVVAGIRCSLLFGTTTISFGHRDAR